MGVCAVSQTPWHSNWFEISGCQTASSCPCRKCDLSPFRGVCDRPSRSKAKRALRTAARSSSVLWEVARAPAPKPSDEEDECGDEDEEDGRGKGPEASTGPDDAVAKTGTQSKPKPNPTSSSPIRTPIVGNRSDEHYPLQQTQTSASANVARNKHVPKQNKKTNEETK
eukprot:GHVT01033172.1.p1 GENE.GHVT01033172.1~~GHVT01033172.1.p1  ORF type:complete len:168 (+),score=27.87 GHVT01033172.1:62-565(+)